MNCEELRQQLPDYALGTVTEIEAAADRRHLRGCGGCRDEAARLDEGVGMLANVHQTDPPPELRDRVMSVLAEEWQETVAPRMARRWFLRPLALAAAVALLVGALAFGSVAQWNASRFHEDALSYENFLHSLGGRAVRVAELRPAAGTQFDGSAIFYDSDKGQSWVLVLFTAPGWNGQIDVTLTGSGGRTIPLHQATPDEEGQVSTWLVTSADISGFTGVRLTAPNGKVLATGSTTGESSLSS